MPSITGFKNRILAAVPEISDGRAERLAKKLAWRAAHMQEEFDFFAQLRILGVQVDPTAAQAIRNIEEAAA